MTKPDHVKKADTKKTMKVRPPVQAEKPAKKEAKPAKKKEEFKHNAIVTDKKVKPSKADHGHVVSVEYVGTLKSGEEFDNSKGHGPIQFIVGSGQVIKGFDTAVVGMKLNESKKFTIPKHEAYGDMNPALVQVIPLAKIPEHVRGQLKVGGFLVMQSPVGQQMPVKIIKMDKDNVHVDMNHPLAGQDLTFSIKLVGIDHAPEGGDDHGCGDGCACEAEGKPGKKKANGEDCCGNGCCH